MKLRGRGLTCIRGGRTVFAGLDFEVGQGTQLALRGANGAGKSSLLRLMAGLLRPAAGTLALTGGDAERSLSEQCHYVGHLDTLKPSLTVRENLTFWHGFLGDAQATVPQALHRVGIGPLADFPAAVLSAGQRRRLALARLIAVRRPVWLLDEPTTALDAQGRTLLAEIVHSHLRAGGLVVVATHGDLADGAAILELGRAQ